MKQYQIRKETYSDGTESYIVWSKEGWLSLWWYEPTADWGNRYIRYKTFEEAQDKIKELQTPKVPKISEEIVG